MGLARACLDAELCLIWCVFGRFRWSLGSCVASWTRTIGSLKTPSNLDFVDTHGLSSRASDTQRTSGLSAKFGSPSPISMANGERKSEKGNRVKKTLTAS